MAKKKPDPLAEWGVSFIVRSLDDRMSLIGMLLGAAETLVELAPQMSEKLLREKVGALSTHLQAARHAFSGSQDL